MSEQYTTQSRENILGLKDVLRLVPVSKVTVYKLINEKNFPPPKRIAGCKKSFWKKEEVERWLDANFN